MDDALPNPPANGQAEPKLKIYFLPNLLTAGQPVLRLRGPDQDRRGRRPVRATSHQIKMALAFILLACIFDLFDGRVARMGGVESPFGREFDSLADLISFGAAPAFLVHRVVLKDVVAGPSGGRAGSSPRFTCCAARSGWRGSTAWRPCHGRNSKEFLGLPHPYRRRAWWRR